MFAKIKVNFGTYYLWCPTRLCAGAPIIYIIYQCHGKLYKR